jgi:hypothetical protein
MIIQGVQHDGFGIVFICARLANSFGSRAGGQLCADEANESSRRRNIERRSAWSGSRIVIPNQSIYRCGRCAFDWNASIWHLQKRGTLTTDVAIGVIFTAALAIGTLVTPSEDLIEALFGGFQSLTLTGFILGMFLVTAILLFIYIFRHKLILSLFSPELAAATGVNISRLDLYFLLAFSTTVLLGWLCTKSGLYNCWILLGERT